MCRLKRPLGRRQLWALDKLLNGYHISEVDMNLTRDIALVDDDKSNYEQFTTQLLNSLMNRELLDMREVYTTVQPDSFHYEYRIKKECSKIIATIIEQNNPKHIQIPKINNQ